MGHVDFFDFGTLVASAPLFGAIGTFDAGTELTPGLHQITADYSGDSAFAPAFSTVLPFTVLARTSITLASIANPAAFGDPLTLIASVKPAETGTAVPAGSVTFFDYFSGQRFHPGLELGTVPLDSSGKATLQTSTLLVENHQITAQYSGDANYQFGPLSSIFSQIISPPSLRATVTRTTFPAAIVVGMASHGVATVQFSNDTADKVKGRVELTLLASQDGISTTTLATIHPRISLAAGHRIQLKVPIHLAPQTLSEGNYVIVARTNAVQGSLIQSGSGPSLRVDAPVVKLMTLPPGGRLNRLKVAAGKSAHVVIVLRNEGNVPSSEQDIHVGLTKDGHAEEISIADLTLKKKIKPGHTKVLHLPVSIPIGTPADAFSCLIEVAEGGNTATITGPIFRVTN